MQGWAAPYGGLPRAERRRRSALLCEWVNITYREKRGRRSKLAAPAMSSQRGGNTMLLGDCTRDHCTERGRAVIANGDR